MTASTPAEDRRLDLERKIHDLQEELNTLRRSAPRTAVENFEFEVPSGAVSLEDLFGAHDDLLVIHNMGQHCPYCTLWADGFIGMQAHFESRAALVLCSPDPPAIQQQFARSRGWRFSMVSDAGGGFTRAMGFSVESGDGRTLKLPGFSTFRRSAEGIERVAHAPFGPGDVFSPIWHFFSALAEGPGDWQPQYTYGGASDGRSSCG